MHEGLALSVARAGIVQGERSAEETARYIQVDILEAGHGVDAAVQILVNLPWFLRKHTMEHITKDLAETSPGDLRDLQAALERVVEASR
jgi:hypothetical protein